MTPAEGVLLRVSGLPCEGGPLDHNNPAPEARTCLCLGCDARRGLKDFAEVIKEHGILLRKLTDIREHGVTDSPEMWSEIDLIIGKLERRS